MGSCPSDPPSPTSNRKQRTTFGARVLATLVWVQSANVKSISVAHPVPFAFFAQTNAFGCPFGQLSAYTEHLLRCITWLKHVAFLGPPVVPFLTPFWLGGFPY